MSEYKNHIATYEKHSDILETLQWKEPGTSHFAVWFVRQHGALMLWGDLGSAVYRWYPDVQMEGISRTNLDYFVEKCVASEYGSPPFLWDDHQAEKDMKEYFAEFHPEEWADSVERKGRNLEADKFESACGWGALSEDEFTWVSWLRESADDIFGQDWWEHRVCDAGKKLGPRIRMHHEGLQLAFAQLKERGIWTPKK